MADWTPIPDAALGEDAPIRSVDVLALRDNPAALARGAPGAPKISPWAMQREIAAGDVLRYADPFNFRLTQPQAAGNWTHIVGVMVLASGTLRVRYSTGRPNSGIIRTQVRRARGTTVVAVGGEEQHSSGSSNTVQNRTVASIDVEMGDSIMMTARFDSVDPSSSSASIFNFRLLTSGAHFIAIGGGSLVTTAEPV